MYFHFVNVASITHIADVSEHYGFLRLGAMLFEIVERRALQAYNSSDIVVVCCLGRFYVMMIRVHKVDLRWWYPHGASLIIK